MARELFEGTRYRRFCGDGRGEFEPSAWRTSKAGTQMDDFGPEGVCRLVSRFVLGHGFGARPAPGGNFALLLRLVTPTGQEPTCRGPRYVALRVTVSARNLVRKGQRKDFSGASAKAELRPWEPGPSLASPV